MTADVADSQHPSRLPCILLIGGSDSSGAAGIAADLRALESLGVHAALAITAATAQSSDRLWAANVLAESMVSDQIDAVCSDFAVDAFKIGMLGGADTVSAVIAAIDRYRPAQVVVDPVLRASAGPALLEPPALQRFCRELLPRSTLLTPNLPEAATLLDCEVDAIEADPAAAVRELAERGPAAVLLKGGHGRGDTLVDWLCCNGRLTAFEHARHEHGARGTGCSLASLIAGRLALGQSIDSACAQAIDDLQRGLATAQPIGSAGRFRLRWR